MNERMAIVETKIEILQSTLDKMDSKMDLLIQERHESIGKKSVLLGVAGVIGGFISQIIEFFKP